VNRRAFAHEPGVRARRAKAQRILREIRGGWKPPPPKARKPAAEAEVTLGEIRVAGGRASEGPKGRG